ncbi:pentatricopeptide repeat-containing protein At1g80270, mitochondrial [Dendrobium catenatum]|uniref:Pentatricopeptide repeat-containing protein n=1 Tax=Dendrobium catenatum TaxID=906689 RepID=A0A2I0X885_9ASPA|nr:pentatricopeptide repeat-containing protein At1g80270, mitochondrial [Dendrobium catenatum]PKU84128.1 Pentatricopeptide repeat-containing protein [Dendrobium catenatum]
MWAIRRAPNPIRNQSCCMLFSHAFYAKPEAFSNLDNGVQYSKVCLINGTYHLTRPVSGGGFHRSLLLVWGRNLSSQVGPKSSDKEDDLEDGFSDLEVPPEIEKIEELAEKNDDELVSEADSAEEDVDEADKGSLAFSDTDEKELAKKSRSSPVFKIIMEATRLSLTSALDQWVEAGNPLGRGEISLALLNLRKRRWYGKALQFMEWLETTKRLEYEEREYASRLDLVAKVQGLQKAENYIDKIPKSFRGEFLYRTLLANCVAAVNVKKAEEVFNKIRDLGFPISTFACNQLILLYKRVDRKKIADVLKMMEKEDVKPSLFTYRLLIDTKGRIHDISGMEEVLATMKAEGIEPDLYVQAVIAKHYIFASENQKAEKLLKNIEGDDISKNRAACKPLLTLYAALGKTDDVERIWNVCEQNPRLEECLAAIEAWGKLGKVEDAEKVFEKMMKSWKRLSSKYYNVLLKVYANHKLLSKGKELAKRMSDNGCRIGPLTWDALVNLYVEAGEVEKADTILHKASEQNQVKPLYNSYISVLEKYADRGDIHNAEKIFHRLRQIGYVGRMRQYQLVLQAYVNAKTPAYGFRERMKADNIFPNKITLAQLQAVDAFRKTQISELLD